jgi:dsDNA-specific endonuclease/ATPase MutS2
MDTKLTLKLDQDVIEKAKDYAKSKKTSLSALIENYLQKLTEDKKDKRKITPLVKSLSGVIDLPLDYNHKNDYADYLINKYK